MSKTRGALKRKKGLSCEFGQIRLRSKIDPALQQMWLYWNRRKAVFERNRFRKFSLVHQDEMRASFPTVPPQGSLRQDEEPGLQPLSGVLSVLFRWPPRAAVGQIQFSQNVWYHHGLHRQNHSNRGVFPPENLDCVILGGHNARRKMDISCQIYLWKHENHKSLSSSQFVLWSKSQWWPPSISG